MIEVKASRVAGAQPSRCCPCWIRYHETKPNHSHYFIEEYYTRLPERKGALIMWGMYLADTPTHPGTQVTKLCQILYQRQMPSTHYNMILATRASIGLCTTRSSPTAAWSLDCLIQFWDIADIHNDWYEREQAKSYMHTDKHTRSSGKSWCMVIIHGEEIKGAYNKCCLSTYI